MQLQKMVALVTGSAGGLGFAIASRFLEEGADVIINDIDAERAQEAGKQLLDARPEGAGQVVVLPADVANEADVCEMFLQIAKRWGRLDILVNNAATVVRSPLKFHTDADWQRVLRTNLDSVFYCSRGALPLMLPRRWGRIINVSSTLGLSGGDYEIAYATSKAGVIGFTKSLAREVGKRNICVNAICPALIEAGVSRDYLSGTGVDARAVAVLLARMTSMPRPLETRDVANVAVMLASRESAYLNGQALVLDGGAR